MRAYISQIMRTSLFPIGLSQYVKNVKRHIKNKVTLKIVLSAHVKLNIADNVLAYYRLSTAGLHKGSKLVEVCVQLINA